MTYTLSISYSNFQHIYGLPHITTAIIVKTIDVDKIPKLLTNDIVEKIKEKSISNVFDPQIAKGTMLPYDNMIVSTKFILVNKPESLKNDDPYERIIKSYYKLLDSKIKSDISLSAYNIDLCILKLPMNKEGVELDKHEVRKKYSFALYNFPVEFQGENDCSGVLDLARLYANDIYLKERRNNIYFINSVLKTNFDISNQIVRILWNSTPVEYYNDDFLAYPKLVIRENHQVKLQDIRPGDSFSFFPIAKYCVGPTAGVDKPIPTCLATSLKRPFGNFLEGSPYEKCKKCGGGQADFSFIYKSRKGGNRLTTIMNEDIYRRVFLGEFALYITNYDNVLKIGRALKNRVVGRLLEQASMDALVFYPIQTYEYANELETILKDFLNEKIDELTCEKVMDKIQQKVRYNNIKKNLNKDNDYILYDHIIRLFKNSNDINIRMLPQLETKILNFKNNWIINNDIPDNLDPILKYKIIKGIINGVIGSFVLINNRAYDFKKIYGYVGVNYD